MANLILSIVRPEGVRYRRVLHADEGDLIVQTIEFEHDGEAMEIEVAYEPGGFGTMLVASMNALDFPEGDCEYIAERLAKDLT